MPARQALEIPFVHAVEKCFAEHLHGDLGWWRDRCHKGMTCFRRLGFPTQRQESWKYTSLASVLRQPLATGGSPIPYPGPLPWVDGLDAHVGVFVDGRLDKSRSSLASLPPGVLVTDLHRAGFSRACNLGTLANSTRHPFVALNTAFLTGGAFVLIDANVFLDKPIHVMHLATSNRGRLAQPRTLVHAFRESRASVIESVHLESAGPSLINAVSEYQLENLTHVSRYELQDPAAHVSCVSSLDVTPGYSSRFENHCFTFGGDVVRNNVRVLQIRMDSETVLNGLFMARNRSHVDNHTLVHHAVPDGFSSENYRGILDDHATGVFNGKVLVAPDAQKTNAYQTNKSIVLSDTARMFAKPELEIYADDVKCSHGATTGQLSEDALFYLRTRGLTIKDARTLLLQAFAGEITGEVPHAALREALNQRVTASLQG